MMTMVVMAALGTLAPTALRILYPAPSPPPPPPVDPPPAAVVLPDELSRDLKGVFTIVSDNGAAVVFGTAFQLDTKGHLMTAAHLVQATRALRLIDNTGGSHAVGLVGIDPTSDLAEVRSDVAGVPLVFADTTRLHEGDSVAVLASPKNGLVAPSTPAVASDLHAARTWQGITFSDLLGVRANLQPSNEGSPLVGPGGTVVGIIGLQIGPADGAAFAIRSEDARMALNAWRDNPEIPLPLAPMPDSLILRGTDAISRP